MYRKRQSNQIEIPFPFDVELSPESKWVTLADICPWELIEDEYAKHFPGAEGQVAKSARLAFGALYIQISEGLTDAKTREHIRENPHMQYFCGMPNYSTEPPFDASLMVYFRKRIPMETIMKVTEEYFAPEALGGVDAAAGADPADGTSGPVGAADGCDNRGTLLLDATCCPQDIRYPTDTGLLDNARELAEEIIDRLYKPVAKQYAYKPRTYRQSARKDYLAFSKMRKPTAKAIRKQIKKQLQYLARDLRIIEGLVAKGAPLDILGNQLYRKLLVIGEVYRQQKEMYDARKHRCDGRIVSIAQPHIRPIVRGKEHNPVEFGSKVAIGLVGGYAFITDASWDNFPEASLLPMAAEKYKSMFGFYPASIIGDRVYPNRYNRDWCKERHIRLSGPALGRKAEDAKRKEKKQIYEDSCERNAIEGEFGVTKRKLGLGRVMAKLPVTSLSAVAMGFFVANMERKLRLLFAPDSQPFVSYDFELSSLVIIEGYPIAS